MLNFAVFMNLFFSLILLFLKLYTQYEYLYVDPQIICKIACLKFLPVE